MGVAAGLGIELKAEGLDKAQKTIEAALEMLQQFKGAFRSVDLQAKRRRDKGDNAIIVAEFKKRGRDFFSPDQKVADAVADKIAELLEIDMQALLDAQRNVEGPAKKIASQKIKQMTGKIMIEAMKVYMDAVVERIQEQKTAGGGAPKPLSEDYARDKQRKHGFTEPIGVATGQLQENLDSSNVGNIRLKR